MYHLVDNFQTKTGDALVGYYVKLKDSEGAYATLYSDTSLTPISTVSGVADTAVTDTTGLYDIYVDDGSYDIEFFDKNDISVLVLRVPDVPMYSNTNVDAAEAQTLATLAASNGSALVGFLQAGTGAVARTEQAKLRDTLSVFDFIPVAHHAAIQDGTTTTDVTAYITAALTYAQTTEYHEKTLVFPAGTYRVSQISLRDCNYLRLHAEGTVNITGIDDGQVWIMGDDRLDELGHVETFTRQLRISGGPWLIAPAAGESYARGLLLQNFVDCVFDNILVSGTYTPTGGTGDRIGVEIDLSFNNSFRDCTFGYAGAPIGADKSYALYFGSDSVNNNRFYSYRSIGGGATVANTIGVRLDGTGNCFYGGDISSIHTCFEDSAARGCHRLNMYHEGVSRVVNVVFASRGCVIIPSYVDIAANGTAYDLGGDSGTVQTIGYQILGGNHKFNASGTTGIEKGTNCYGLTYQPAVDTSNLPATISTGTDRGSGGSTYFNAFETTVAKLNFPDTPVASSNATTLDCYKEQDLTNFGISVGATAQTATSAVKVTKIGRVVTITGNVTMGAAVSGTGNLTITGLPYAASGLAAMDIKLTNVSYGGTPSAEINGSTITLFQTSEAGTQTNLTHANLASNSIITFSATYTASS